MYQANIRDLITKLPQSNKQNTFNEQIFKSR